MIAVNSWTCGRCGASLVEDADSGEPVGVCPTCGGGHTARESVELAAGPGMAVVDVNAPATSREERIGAVIRRRGDEPPVRRERPALRGFSFSYGRR